MGDTTIMDVRVKEKGIERGRGEWYGEKGRVCGVGGRRKREGGVGVEGGK